jgi:Fe-S cluster assembly scaffold protein SufB
MNATQEANSLVVNHLPGQTWNWLKMNDARVAVEASAVPLEAQMDVPEGLSKGQGLSPVGGGMGPDYDRWIQQNAEPQVFQTAEGQKVVQPLKLTYALNGGATGAAACQIDAKADSRLTVIMDFAGQPEGQPGTAAFSTKLRIASGAAVTLVQIHRSGAGQRILNDVGAVLEDGARFDVLHLIMDGSHTYVGCQADLKGDQSYFNADVAYLVQNEDLLDTNYVALHHGKKTESRITSAGVLRDRAQKLFRGTIDFKKGAAGSVGNEKEDVMLMDDTVVNKTIPLILCAEEDVEGNHGATIGKLDDALLFYMESRGMDADEIYEMIAKSKLEAASRLIPDQAVREDVQAYIEAHQGRQE